MRWPIAADVCPNHWTPLYPRLPANRRAGLIGDGMIREGGRRSKVTKMMHVGGVGVLGADCHYVTKPCDGVNGRRKTAFRVQDRREYDV